MKNITNEKWLPTVQLEDVNLLKKRESALINSIIYLEKLENYEICQLHYQRLQEVQKKIKTIKE